MNGHWTPFESALMGNVNVVAKTNLTAMVLPSNHNYGTCATVCALGCQGKAAIDEDDHQCVLIYLHSQFVSSGGWSRQRCCFSWCCTYRRWCEALGGKETTWSHGGHWGPNHWRRICLPTAGIMVVFWFSLTWRLHNCLSGRHSAVSFWQSFHQAIMIRQTIISISFIAHFIKLNLPVICHLLFGNKCCTFLIYACFVLSIASFL